MKTHGSMMWSAAVACAGAWCGILVAPAAGQTSQPATLPAAEGSSVEGNSADLPVGLTLIEAVQKAYQLIDVAETKKEGAAAAIRELDGLLGFLRAKDPTNADADFLFGRMHLLLKRPREAMQYIDRYAVSAKGSTDWLAFRMLGDLYLEAKYSTMAADKYRKATELSPSQPAPHAGLARTELQQGRAGSAQEHARKAVDLDSVKPPAERDPQYYSVLAEALLSEAALRGQGKLDQAAQAAAQAVELGRASLLSNPSDPALLEKLDGYQGLLERVIRGIIKNFPERGAEYVRLAQVLRERADINHLLKYHNILITIETAIDRSAPNTPTALLVEQAGLLFAVGDVAKARAVLDEVLTKEPENAAALQLLSELGGPRSARAPDR